MFYHDRLGIQFYVKLTNLLSDVVFSNLFYCAAELFESFFELSEKANKLVKNVYSKCPPTNLELI